MVSIDSGFFDFSEEEIVAVRKRFPKLSLQSSGTWRGEINIDAIYNNEPIKDSFTVLIVATDKYPEEPPVLVEMGGRSDAIAEKYKLKDRRDLHYNIQTRIACLCVKQEEKIRFPAGSNLLDFIDNLVIPYLYGLSYFDRYGKWPWPEYSHGNIGLLEYYGINRSILDGSELVWLTQLLRNDPLWKEYNKQLRKLSKDRSCLCGSSKPLKRCHPNAWEGLVFVKNEIGRLNLNVNILFSKTK